MDRQGRMVATLVAFVAGAGLLAKPAAAQTAGILPLRVKVGVLLPQDGKTKKYSGNTFLDGEVELALPSLSGGRTLVTAGYSEGSKSGRKLRVIPLTVSRVFSPPNPAAGLTGNVYFGIGVGAYLLRASGGGVSNSKTTLGGFGVAGYQFPNAFFVEAKYHAAGKVAGLSPNGVALLLGRRF